MTVRKGQGENLVKDAIVHGRLYAFAEAAALIPSPRGGHVSAETLRRWRKEGRFAAVRRTVGGKRWWFVRGDELERLLASLERAEPAKAALPPSAAEEDARLRRMRVALRKLGLLK